MGLKSRITYGVQADYSTIAADLTRGLRFNTESLAANIETINSAGIGGADPREAIDSAFRTKVAEDASGPIQCEGAVEGQGLLWEHALGGVATVDNLDGSYTHTFTPDADFIEKFLTIQKGVEDREGNVQPYTLIGAIISKIGISVSSKQFALLDLEVNARECQTDVTLEPNPVWPEVNLWNFAQAGVTADFGSGASSIATLKSGSVMVENTLDDDSYFLGATTLKSQPRDNDNLKVTGQLVAAHNSDALPFVTAYKDDADLAFVLTFTGPQVGTTPTAAELKITVPHLRVGGEVPNVGGKQIPDITIPFEGLHNGTDPSITVELTTTDETP